jgi:CMP-N-acetylneuraminic acid synthetase
MYKGKTILGLIPARGGSKGLPGKNIKPLLGTPLIAWTIKQAFGSKYLDMVAVSTDSRHIAAVAKKYGAEVPFIRPKRLATDKSKVIDTILHALKYFEKSGMKFDYLALLETTSPLRKDGDIDNAIKMLIGSDQDADSLISVGKIALEHPAYAKTLSWDGLVESYIDSSKRVAMLRQNLPIVYFPYGVIYLSKVSSIKRYNAAYAGKILPYLIERWQNYEINDMWDFMCVESILANNKKEIQG